MPSNLTCLAPACTPAFSRTVLSGTPRHFALPIAPLASWPPATRGVNSPRLLPEHWLTATYSIESSFLRSATLSVSGVLTLPFTLIVKVSTSISVGTPARW